VAAALSNRIPFDLIADPVKFQAAFLKRQLWSKQKEICRAVATHGNVAVKGCHASGKTYDAAGLALWWLMRYDRGIVVQISPTMRQVKTFWNEIAIAARESEIRFPDVDTAKLSLSRDRYAIGVSSTRGVNVQGFHGDNVLIITDESPGIEEEIWDAIEGIMAGGDVSLLRLGNPTVPSGEFHNCFHRERKRVKGITISAFDSPNFEGISYDGLMSMPDAELDTYSIKYLTRRRWAHDFIQKWGREHPKVRARVFGEFPEQATNAVFPLAWIERAALPYEPEELDKLPDRAEIRWGLDVAGPGDDHTALCAMVFDYIILQKSYIGDARGAVARDLTGLMIDPRYRRFRLGRGLVDTVGIGYYFAKHIADVFKDPPGHERVFGFIANAAPVDQVSFHSAKDEIYWNYRQRLERRAVHGMLDEDCQAQMSDTLYRENSRGQTQVESKDELRERKPGAPSPDEAEAAIMAGAPIVRRIQHVGAPGYAQISPI
jgi:hypothetical protein